MPPAATDRRLRPYAGREAREDHGDEAAVRELAQLLRESLAAVGGLDKLKAWLDRRKNAFGAAARHLGDLARVEARGQRWLRDEELLGGVRVALFDGREDA